MKTEYVIVMGVSGCGKSTLGRALAEKAGGVFVEGDDFHPPENVAKMSAGVPLNDGDRAGWLEALAGEMRRAEGRPVVVSCSALKEKYREVLRVNEEVRFVYLEGTEAELQARLVARTDHFMPASLLRSQLETLEVPEDAVRVPIELPTEEMVEVVMGELE
ncbi:MAG: gluconokinase [Verrucomicrobiaceae bacterium]